jgi:hypothetical protein
MLAWGYFVYVAIAERSRYRYIEVFVHLESYMGLDIVVLEEKRTLSEALSLLMQQGDEIEIMMLDGALVNPEATLPLGWNDVRLQTSAGTVTVTRRDVGLAVVVFGNAGQALRDIQKKIAATLSGE